jgi:hypothetical protein
LVALEPPLLPASAAEGLALPVAAHRPANSSFALAALARRRSPGSRSWASSTWGRW